MKTKNQVHYDKKTDTLWLEVKSGAEEEHREISPGISIELDKKGELLGVEIMNASKVLGSKMGLKSDIDDYSNIAIPHKIR